VEILAFWGLVWVDFPNLSQKDQSFRKLGYVIKMISAQYSSNNGKNEVTKKPS